MTLLFLFQCEDGKLPTHRHLGLAYISTTTTHGVPHVYTSRGKVTLCNLPLDLADFKLLCPILLKKITVGNQTSHAICPWEKDNLYD